MEKITRYSTFIIFLNRSFTLLNSFLLFSANPIIHYLTVFVQAEKMY